MKRIREKNGQKIAFIEKQDVETLLISRYCYIPELIFTEPSIRDMKCNEEGYYEILEPAHVEYIANLGFIPDYDYLASLSQEEITKLADKAVEDKKKLGDVITKLCDCKQKLKLREKRILNQATYLEPRVRNYIEDNVLNAGLEGTMFRTMEEVILAQARNYVNAIVAMAERPELTSGITKVKKF